MNTTLPNWKIGSLTLKQQQTHQQKQSKTCSGKIKGIDMHTSHRGHHLK